MKQCDDLVLRDFEDHFFRNICIENIMFSLKSKPEVLKQLCKEDIYRVLLLSKDNAVLNTYLYNNLDIFLNKSISSYEIYDFFSLLLLLSNPMCKEKCKNIFRDKVSQFFSTTTIIFLKKISRQLETKHLVLEELFDLILCDVNKLNTVDASKILIDLCHFTDFQPYLKSNYPTVEFVIRKNLEAYPTAKGRNMVLGGSIIAKLVRSNHEQIIDDWIDILQNVNYTNEDEITMIGAASTCLVFKIGNYVLKIGENRVSRRVFINHRIIASQHRKYHHDEKGNPLFYTEIMRFAKVGDVTKQERDELVEDLLKQGLVWSDSKLENCGVLFDDDENIPNMEVDYEEILGHVEESAYKLEFKKRKRKVVVIDNDIIDRDPKSMWKMN